MVDNTSNLDSDVFVRICGLIESHSVLVTSSMQQLYSNLSMGLLRFTLLLFIHLVLEFELLICQINIWPRYSCLQFSVNFLFAKKKKTWRCNNGAHFHILHGLYFSFAPKCLVSFNNVHIHFIKNVFWKWKETLRCRKWWRGPLRFVKNWNCFFPPPNTFVD